MQEKIDIREIPIFKYFEPEAQRELASHFQKQVYKSGEKILAYGGNVSGIFIIVDGDVEVTIPKLDEPLARLTRGQCFGEMSLIEGIETASANVVVVSPEVILLHCSVNEFKSILRKIPGSSNAFFEGAACLLSSRLRHVNSRLDEEIAQGHKLVKDILKSSEVDLQLSETRSEVNQTGDKVVGKLMQIMPYFAQIEKKYPEAKQDFSALQKTIEEVFLVDAQNFDRISQQLDLILQHFNNLKRVANGGNSVPVVGDRSLFKKVKQAG